jgi:hypothetical protein
MIVLRGGAYPPPPPEQTLGMPRPSWPPPHFSGGVQVPQLRSTPQPLSTVPQLKPSALQMVGVHMELQLGLQVSTTETTASPRPTESDYSTRANHHSGCLTR